MIAKGLKDIKLDISPEELYQPVSYILSMGGKRIRPALVLLSANLFSDDIALSLKPAIGIEIFHNFTLMHDDIMDNAELRRNKLTVYHKWGSDIAILSGDVMLIIAFRYIAESGCRNQPAIISLFNRTAVQVCEGQQYDMNFEKVNHVSVDEYLKMIRLKTAVLLGASLKTGALSADGPAKDADLLYEFGLHMGMAFQIQDDLLDVFADNAKFGKKRGGDIISNKKTYLLLTALQDAGPSTREELLYWISSKDFVPDEKIMAVKSVYDRLNVKEKTEARISEYFTMALHALERIDVPDERKQELKNIAYQLMERTW